jgi:hypothetical protein
MLKDKQDYTAIRIPKHLLEKLTGRAVANKRSATKELQTILEQVLKG